MPAKRSLTLALALLLVAAIPARAAVFPAITVVDTIRPGVDGSYALWNNGHLGDYLYFGADDGVNGYELWRTNGTSTTRVADILDGADSSSPHYLTPFGDYLYFSAYDGTSIGKAWRINAAGIIESSLLPGTNAYIDCMCDSAYIALNGRLFAAFGSSETGNELGYFDDPTFGLPETNSGGSAWSTVLVLLAALTAVAGIGLRMPEAKRR